MIPNATDNITENTLMELIGNPIREKLKSVL
jgi:hypothetical protein